MFQVLKFLQSHIGEKGLMILVGLMLITSASAFLIYTITADIRRKRFKLSRTLAVAISLFIILVLAWQIENFAERIHIAEYVILGWFAVRDLIKLNKKIKVAISACIFCAVVGLIDEIFQGILPYRYFDLNDIVSNTLGGIWGTVLYLITSEGR